MKGSLRKIVEKLNSGDVVCVEWCDASTGKSSSYAGVIDVPVRSWGVFVGLFGSQTKHVVLAQNSFQYADGVYDLDYTAIPLSWAVNVAVIERGHFPAEVAAVIGCARLHESTSLNGLCKRGLLVKQKQGRRLLCAVKVDAEG